MTSVSSSSIVKVPLLNRSWACLNTFFGQASDRDLNNREMKVEGDYTGFGGRKLAEADVTDPVSPIQAPKSY